MGPRPAPSRSRVAEPLGKHRSCAVCRVQRWTPPGLRPRPPPTAGRGTETAGMVRMAAGGLKTIFSVQTRKPSQLQTEKKLNWDRARNLHGDYASPRATEAPPASDSRKPAAARQPAWRKPGKVRGASTPAAQQGLDQRQVHSDSHALAVPSYDCISTSLTLSLIVPDVLLSAPFTPSLLLSSTFSSHSPNPWPILTLRDTDSKCSRFRVSLGHPSTWPRHSSSLDILTPSPAHLLLPQRPR